MGTHLQLLADDQGLLLLRHVLDPDRSHAQYALQIILRLPIPHISADRVEELIFPLHKLVILIEIGYANQNHVDVLHIELGIEKCEEGVTRVLKLALFLLLAAAVAARKRIEQSLPYERLRKSENRDQDRKIKNVVLQDYVKVRELILLIVLPDELLVDFVYDIVEVVRDEEDEDQHVAGEDPPF